MSSGKDVFQIESNGKRCGQKSIDVWKNEENIYECVSVWFKLIMEISWEKKNRNEKKIKYWKVVFTFQVAQFTATTIKMNLKTYHWCGGNL